jgi:hAT family C-terminal dimerisation region
MSTTAQGEAASKAGGLVGRFRDGITILGISVCLEVFDPLEQLNRCLQSTSVTMSGMFAASELVKAQLIALRTDDHFKLLFENVLQLCIKYNLDPVTLPRQRRPPLRYAGSGESHAHETAEGHFRAAFYQAVDTALNQLNLRINKDSIGMRTYLSLEQILISGNVPVETDNDICFEYSEVSNLKSLKIQLSMFRTKHPVKSLLEAQKTFQDMVPEVRSLFSDVEQLIRLMLICPVSSCTAERSFSALRRLKNWLRSTMGQQRLNAVAVCHIHKSVLDELDLKQLAAEFSQRSDIRRGIFGHWSK